MKTTKDQPAKAVLLLAKTLEDGKHADVKLTEIAMAHINVAAAH